MSNVRELLLHVQSSQAFDLLEPYRHDSVWKNLSQDNRLLLARLLVLQGAGQMATQESAMLESFAMAARISSQAPDILYQQAEILGNHRHDPRWLSLAAERLAQLIAQDPSTFKYWYLRAQVLADLGWLLQELSPLQEADEAYDRAGSLWSAHLDGVTWADLCWARGKCQAAMSQISGEPLDGHRAVTQYRLAYETGLREATFLNDFGQSLAHLATLLEQPLYFSEALLLFNQAVKQDPASFEGWYHQACSLQSLMEVSDQPQLLEQADHSFSKAAEINPNHSDLWLKWGELEMARGRMKRDPEKLASGMLKLAQADQLRPDHPPILNSWAEAEISLGVQQERLELIQGARTKLSRSLEVAPNNPTTWYLSGCALNELGGYFSEAEYYDEAIGKFQYGLSLDRRHPLLWYGMALSYYALGELREEVAYFEKSDLCFSRAVECGGGGFAQFWNDWGVVLMKWAEATDQVALMEKAVDKFEYCLKKPIKDEDPDELDLEWVHNYGIAFDLMGDLKDEPACFEKAVQIFTQILQIDPHYQPARYHLALALSHLADTLCDVELYFKSITLFQLILESDPEDEMAHLDLGMSLTNLALLVQDVHHPERFHTLCRQAEHHFMQAAALGSVQAYYQLAGVYSIMGYYDQAMHYLERAKFFDALPEVEDLLHDEWLENIRQLPIFQQFINRPFA